MRIGITEFAQNALGDIVFVQLPALDTAVAAGQPVGEIESTKSVSDVFAPVNGIVTARNEALDQSPDLVNSDPYGEGWLFELTVTAPVDSPDLMDAAAYQQQSERERVAR